MLIAMSGSEPHKIAVAIETPHGPVVEMLIEHGFAVHSIIPSNSIAFAIASRWRSQGRQPRMPMCSVIR